MNKNIETELKTIVTEEQFKKITDLYQPLNFITQINTYYVTSDISHYAFRVRVKDGKQLFTLKQAYNGSIMEHEMYFEGDIEDQPEILETLNQFGLQPPFKPFGQLNTQRAMVIDEWAELCFDINEYNGIKDYEIEYEIKKEHDYHAAFKRILDQANIEYVPSYASKYKRCLNSLLQNTDK